MRYGQWMLAVLVCAAVLVAGCQEPAAQESAGLEQRTLITSEDFGLIAGRQWTLERMVADGTEYALEGRRPFVQLQSDGTIAGYASVNRFGGTLGLDKQGRITLSPLATTRMAGPVDRMEQEETFLRALGNIDRLSVAGDRLAMQSLDGTMELVFVEGMW